MSKKNKVSSGKKTKAKPDKKNVSKKQAAKKPVTPKKAAKPAAKKSSKPAPKKVVKKIIKAVKSAPKKISPKNAAPVKPVSKDKNKKADVKKTAPAKPVKNSKPVVAAKPEPKKASAEKKHEFKRPVSRKDTEVIPEFKPIIQPTVKTEAASKENFPSSLKSTGTNSFITTPAKKTDSYSIKPEKEPNGKFELEFVIRASAELLYEFLVTPSGLSEWFCDDVNIRNGIYTFVWDGQLQQARLLKTIEEQLVRYQWVDKTDGSYFEFKIQRDELTNDISLMVIDFASEKSEADSSKLLWTSQIDKLLHVLGSYF